MGRKWIRWDAGCRASMGTTKTLHSAFFSQKLSGENCAKNIIIRTLYVLPYLQGYRQVKQSQSKSAEIGLSY